MSELSICPAIVMSLKTHNFPISYPTLLKLYLIGLSDFSASIESKLFLDWTCPLIKSYDCRTVLVQNQWKMKQFAYIMKGDSLPHEIWN